uniref:triacylglycerol lipase n=1 Tax=Echeneis naucrates TaxID=173247 RepID=A0A665X209_ECHNA
MFDLQKEWSISFAGCGFMGIYYVGASSCILERLPRLFQDAFKMYGASAGSLMAAVLSVDKCCANLMFMAREARKSRVGPLHPAFNLLQRVQDSLHSSLPADAHVRASGRLCVSLTRVSDGKNVLVSEFESREELIQVLLCSCFVPFYCGVIPPTYRGVRYVDGAISDNLPRCRLKNTITFSAYAGESDVCPRSSTLKFHEVHFNNVSIQQFLSSNLIKYFWVLQTMSGICQKGYMDALRFLQEHNLISSESPLRALETDSPEPACCELMKERANAEEANKDTQQMEMKPPQKEHDWLDPQLIEKLPADIRKVLCEACRESHTTVGLLSRMTEYLPKKVTSYLQIPCTLPLRSAYSLAHRLVDWIPDVPKDMSWLYSMAEDIYKQAESPLHRCTSLPLGLNLWNNRKEDPRALPVTPEATPTSSLTITCNKHGDSDHMPLTPPPTPSLSTTSGFEATVEMPESAGRGWGLSEAVGWIRNTTHSPSNHKKTDDQ